MTALPKQSFNAGEITPRLFGRTDLARYLSALATCLNAMPQSHGSIIRRPGLEYIATGNTPTTAIRLIPFEFSITQAYIIEAGQYYMRFYRDGGQITSAGSAVEIATPYMADDLFELQFVQSADVLYIVHGNYSPRKLARTSHIAWTLSVIAFTGAPSDWGAISKAITGITAADPGVVTSVGHGLSDGDTVLLTNILGMTELNGTTQTVANKAADTFEIEDTSAMTAYVSGGFWNETDQPQTVTFHEERIVFGSIPSEPQTIYFSKSGDFEVMTQGVADDDGFQYSIAADQVNAIRWIRSIRKLIVGTLGAEWAIDGAGPDEPLTPTSIKVVRDTTHGSQLILPETIDNQVLFVQRPGRNIRALKYEFNDDAYIGTDLSILAEHLTVNFKILQIGFQRVPSQTLWCVRNDGTLIALTYIPEHEVVAWHRHTTGNENTPGAFKSVAVIPGDDESEVWVVVQRTVNNSEVRYIERLSEQTREDLDIPSAPVISPSNATGLTAPQLVTITAGIVQGTIFYTTDGSLPSASSNEYLAPFNVSLDVTIRAAVRDDDNSVFSGATTSTLAFLKNTFKTSAGLTFITSDGKTLKVIAE